MTFAAWCQEFPIPTIQLHVPIVHRLSQLGSSSLYFTYQFCLYKELINPTPKRKTMARMINRNVKEKVLSPPPAIPQISADGTNPQDECPLFSTLPAEIRQRIYVMALSSFDDPSKPFNPQHHHYRPGHRFRQQHDFRLLQTCKRVWRETRLLPIMLNEIIFYLYRGPRSNLPSYSQHDWRMRYRSLNKDQRQAVHTVHFYAQQCYLESTPNLLSPQKYRLSTGPYVWLFDETGPDHMTAKRIVLTLRRSDWWSWESPPKSNDQLGICPWRTGRTNWKQMEQEALEGPEIDWEGWGGQFRYVKGLEVLEIEFEAVDAKKPQLDRVVGRAKHWRFPTEDDKVLIWTGQISEWSWEGAAILKEDNGDRGVQLRSVREDTRDEKRQMCTYVVMRLKWRLAERDKAERDAGGGLS